MTREALERENCGADVEDAEHRRSGRLGGEQLEEPGALATALAGAEAAGAATRLLDIHVLELPIYNPDDDEPTAAAAELIEACYAADGLPGAVRSIRGRSPAR